MTHCKLRVDVQGIFISVSLRGTCLWVRYRRQEAPWLAADAYGPDHPEASLTFNEFRALAPERLREALRGDGVVVDLRNVWDPAAMRAAGLRYSSIGRP